MWLLFSHTSRPLPAPQVRYAILWLILCGTLWVLGSGGGDLLCFKNICSHANYLAIYSSICALRCYLINDGDGYVHSCNLEIGWISLSGCTTLLGLVVCNI